MQGRGGEFTTLPHRPNVAWLPPPPKRAICVIFFLHLSMYLQLCVLPQVTSVLRKAIFGAFEPLRLYISTFSSKSQNLAELGC